MVELYVIESAVISKNTDDSHLTLVNGQLVLKSSESSFGMLKILIPRVRVEILVPFQTIPRDDFHASVVPSTVHTSDSSFRNRFRKAKVRLRPLVFTWLYVDRLVVEAS